MMSEMPLPMPRDGDLLAEPHQEHGAAGQREDGGEAEEPAGIDDDTRRTLEADRNAVGLEYGKHHGQVAGVLVDDLAAGFAFLLQRLELRNDGRHQLQDDRRGNVGHDPEREDRHALDGAAGEHVEHAEDAGRLLLKRLPQRLEVDARQRNVGAQPVDEQRAEREPNALLQLLRLGEGGEVQIGGKLFCC